MFWQRQGKSDRTVDQHHAEWWKQQAETWKRKYEDAQLSFDAERRYLLVDNVTVEQWPDLEPGFFRSRCKRLSDKNFDQMETIDSQLHRISDLIEENRELQEALDIQRAENKMRQDLLHALNERVLAEQSNREWWKRVKRYWNRHIDKDYSVTWGEYITLIVGGCVLGSLVGWILGEVSER